TDVPVLPSSRHSPRAAARSARASTIATSALPASNNDDTSVGAVRTLWASSDNEGSTDSGCGSAVNSSRSNWPSSAPGQILTDIAVRDTSQIRNRHLGVTGCNNDNPSRIDWPRRAGGAYRVGQNVRVRRLLIGVVSTVAAVTVAAVGVDFGTAIYAEY